MQIVETFESKLSEALSLKGRPIIVVLIINIINFISGILFVTNLFDFVGNTFCQLRRGRILVQEM